MQEQFGTSPPPFECSSCWWDYGQSDQELGSGQHRENSDSEDKSELITINWLLFDYRLEIFFYIPVLIANGQSENVRVWWPKCVANIIGSIFFFLIRRMAGFIRCGNMFIKFLKVEQSWRDESFWWFGWWKQILDEKNNKPINSSLDSFAGNQHFLASQVPFFALGRHFIKLI